MRKKLKIIIFLSLFFIFNFNFQTSFAKYVIEDISVVANLDIDRSKPTVSLISITNSNTNYPLYANKNHLITARIKLIDKNIVKCNFSQNNIKITVDGKTVNPTFKTFYLASEDSNGKIYEFSFTNTLGDGSLAFILPEGVIEDKSGLVNKQTIISTDIIIDNTCPITIFKEISSSDNKSIAKITTNEPVQSITGWNISSNSTELNKEFSNYISYNLPVMDLAQNISPTLIDIKNATNILLKYGAFDDYSDQTLVTGGKISSPKTISSNSICKSEAIYFKLSGEIDSSLLQGRCYLYTHWGNSARGVCKYSELFYYHGYNPTSNSEWIDLKSRNVLYYKKEIFAQLGGVGLNFENATSTNINIPIPGNVAKQYLYGISGIQFQLKNNSNFSVVYQVYVKDVGWLPVSYDGEENFYKHTKPISAFRMNLVPKSEKQYLIDYWNQDVGSNNLD